MKSFFLFILIFISASFYSQNSIKGTVLDSLKNPIPFCPMVLLSAADSSQIKGNLSDSSGNYVFEKIKNGTYFIKFDFVGYKASSSNTFVIDSTSGIILPTQILKPLGVNLNEVSVAVYKPTIEFSKGTVILNVENDIIAQGNTVFDLLKRLPGVSIDAQNNISINGATGIRFMIDERMQQMPTPQVLDMLAGMSADLVSKIELIKNPPAKYDAAGTGGIINIVTKKAKINGYNGNISFGTSQGKRLRAGPSASFNYKTKRFSFFSNFSYGYWEGQNETTLERKIIVGSTTENIDKYGTQRSYQNVFFGSLGAEFDLTKNTIMGLYLNGNGNDDQYNDVSNTSIKNSSFFNFDNTESNSTTKYQIVSPNVNYSLLQKIDTTGGKIKLSLGYNNYKEHELGYFTNRFYSNALEIAPISSYGNDADRSFEIYTGKIDFNKTFKHKISLESGLSANIESAYSNAKLDFTNQSTGFFVGDTSFYNTGKLNQNILAAYSTIGKEWEKVGFTIGLRAEQTDINIDYISNNYIYKRNYLSFFPSGSLDFNLNENHSFTTTYSYRIRRPHYGMLNPIRHFNEQLNINVGNPEIRPEFSHKFTLDYIFMKSLTISSGYDQRKDFTFWYSYTPENSRVNIDTVSNLPKFQNAYISVSFQYRIKWYNINFYSVLTHQEFEGQLIGESINSKTNQFYFNTSQDITLPKDFRISIWYGRGSALRHGPQVYLPRSAFHISINKSFFNKKLNLTIGLQDVLYQDYFSYTTTYTNQSFYMKDLQDTRRIRFNISYRFGKMQFQQRLNEGGQGMNMGR